LLNLICHEKRADRVAKEDGKEKEGYAMNLKTSYLGMKLRTPLVPSASPLSESLDGIKRMEDAGAAAVVLHSLFEEHLGQESKSLSHGFDLRSESLAEALPAYSEPTAFRIGPDRYFNEIASAKEAVAIPVIASLNGTTSGGWINYAKQIEQAGADALELNIYWIPTDPALSGAEVEKRYLEILTRVRAAVRIPVAVKLSPFFSSLPNMAKEHAEAGADGLVLFNRFYQPDINAEALDVEPHIVLSTSMAMRLPLRWIAILSGWIEADLAATSGIHRAIDVIKLLMAGADVTMLCSVLLQSGIGQIRVIEREMGEWMEKHGHDSVAELQGSMSQKNRHCSDPTAFERAQYVRGVSTAQRTVTDE
jgi:dihydroorotate dehydrogenase (fumarate)